MRATSEEAREGNQRNAYQLVSLRTPAMVVVEAELAVS